MQNQPLSARGFAYQLMMTGEEQLEAAHRELERFSLKLVHLDGV